MGHEEDTRQEIMALLKEIEERLEILSDKTFEFTNIVERSDAIAHDKHLNQWVKFVDRLANRTRSFMRALKDATQGTVDRGIVQLSQTQGIRENQSKWKEIALVFTMREKLYRQGFSYKTEEEASGGVNVINSVVSIDVILTSRFYFYNKSCQLGQITTVMSQPDLIGYYDD